MLTIFTTLKKYFHFANCWDLANVNTWKVLKMYLNHLGYITIYTYTMLK